jgi:hypothetical protein
MGSNGLPPRSSANIPVSPPPPLPTAKRKVSDGTDCPKADAHGYLAAMAMLGMTMDFSMLGVLDSPSKNSEEK